LVKAISALIKVKEGRYNKTYKHTPKIRELMEVNKNNGKLIRRLNNRRVRILETPEGLEKIS